jgi:hypothetical protein
MIGSGGIADIRYFFRTIIKETKALTTNPAF